MSKPLITIYKDAKKPEAIKSASLYIGTHERLAAFQKECGLSIPKLLEICVNFTLEHAIISDEQAPGYKIESEEK